MKRYLPGSTLAAALLAGALFASATGGAVAGSLITGKQIKDSSLTGKDVKDKSLTTGDLSPETVAALHGQTGASGLNGPPGAAGVSGYVVVTASDTQSGNSAGLQADGTCPAGHKPLGATASFSRRFSLAPVVQTLDETTIRAFGINDGGGEETLTLKVYCATVG